VARLACFRGLFGRCCGWWMGLGSFGLSLPFFFTEGYVIPDTLLLYVYTCRCTSAAFISSSSSVSAELISLLGCPVSVACFDVDASASVGSCFIFFFSLMVYYSYYSFAMRIYLPVRSYTYCVHPLPLCCHLKNFLVFLR